MVLPGPGPSEHSSDGPEGRRVGIDGRPEERERQRRREREREGELHSIAERGEESEAEVDDEEEGSDQPRNIAPLNMDDGDDGDDDDTSVSIRPRGTSQLPKARASNPYSRAPNHRRQHGQGDSATQPLLPHGRGDRANQHNCHDLWCCSLYRRSRASMCEYSLDPVYSMCRIEDHIASL